MKYLRKIGKYIIYIEYLTYSICLINITDCFLIEKNEKIFSLCNYRTFSSYI